GPKVLARGGSRISEPSEYTRGERAERLKASRLRRLVPVNGQHPSKALSALCFGCAEGVAGALPWAWARIKFCGKAAANRGGNARPSSLGEGFLFYGPVRPAGGGKRHGSSHEARCRGGSSERHHGAPQGRRPGRARGAGR